MSDPKYIIVKEIPTKYGEARNVAIVFADIITHEHMAEAYGGKENISGAGFLAIGANSDFGNEYYPYGESTSLDRKCQEEDKETIRLMFEQY